LSSRRNSENHLSVPLFVYFCLTSHFCYDKLIAKVHFEKRGAFLPITYQEHKNQMPGLTVERYNELRVMAGWVALTENQAKAGIENSQYVIAAFDGQKAVGFARVIGDSGGYARFVVDVMVDTDYRGQKIGAGMMQRLMTAMYAGLKPGEFVNVNLIASKGKEPFYEKFGLSATPLGTCGSGMTDWKWLKSDGTEYTFKEHLKAT
jgi:GNAT superfamily N-acetyltransferase